ncbi:alpha/beta hydrolase [Bacillus sp. B15-48]|uniref:alpha/beta fold hydrolase n=1 Tax=Bacillus sp. B15-48 TaxID=1548601 RepID=UPI00193F9E98|nr:alpha/beta hydrolase [Bacillus sp. B15-48]
MITRRFIDVEVKQIHYRECGQGECLLLIHEMPRSSKVFVPLMHRLREHLHVIAPDLPGYGDSELPTERLCMQQYARLLLQMMDQLGIRQFSVLGVHMGASVAVEMAYQAPYRVKKLILNGVPLFQEDERLKLHQNLKAFELEESGGHFQQWWDFFQQKWGKQTSKVVNHDAVMDVMKAGTTYDWGYREAFDYDPEPALRKLKQPIFLLISKEDPLLSKNKLVRQMLQHPEEVVVDVPYHLAQTAPDETAKLVVEFLKNMKLLRRNSHV